MLDDPLKVKAILSDWKFEFKKASGIVKEGIIYSEKEIEIPEGTFIRINPKKQINNGEFEGICVVTYIETENNIIKRILLREIENNERS